MQSYMLLRAQPPVQLAFFPLSLCRPRPSKALAHTLFSTLVAQYPIASSNRPTFFMYRTPLALYPPKRPKSGVGSASQTKERSVHELFAGAFRNKSLMSPDQGGGIASWAALRNVSCYTPLYRSYSHTDRGLAGHSALHKRSYPLLQEGKRGTKNGHEAPKRL